MISRVAFQRTVIRSSRAMPLWPALKPRPMGTLGGLRRFATAAAEPKKKMTMKQLVKDYGWTATGVYLALSAIDLPLFYLLVHSLGKENLLEAEIKVREFFGLNTSQEGTFVGKAMSSSKGAFLAEFGVAYVLHKLFLVVRVPVTVAITPAVANKLQKWGLNLKKGIPKIEKPPTGVVKDAGDGIAKTAKDVAKGTADTVNQGRSQIKAAIGAGTGTGTGAGAATSPVSKLGPVEENAGSQLKAKNDFGTPPTKKNKWISWLM